MTGVPNSLYFLFPSLLFLFYQQNAAFSWAAPNGTYPDATLMRLRRGSSQEHQQHSDTLSNAHRPRRRKLKFFDDVYSSFESATDKIFGCNGVGQAFWYAASEYAGIIPFGKGYQTAALAFKVVVQSSKVGRYGACFNEGGQETLTATEIVQLVNTVVEQKITDTFLAYFQSTFTSYVDDLSGTDGLATSISTLGNDIFADDALAYSLAKDAMSLSDKLDTLEGNTLSKDNYGAYSFKYQGLPLLATAATYKHMCLNLAASIHPSSTNYLTLYSNLVDTKIPYQHHLSVARIIELEEEFVNFVKKSTVRRYSWKTSTKKKVRSRVTDPDGNVVWESEWECDSCWRFCDPDCTNTMIKENRFFGRKKQS